jgi:hypothetical protein
MKQGHEGLVKQSTQAAWLSLLLAFLSVQAQEVETIFKNDLPPYVLQNQITLKNVSLELNRKAEINPESAFLYVLYLEMRQNPDSVKTAPNYLKQSTNLEIEVHKTIVSRLEQQLAFVRQSDFDPAIAERAITAISRSRDEQRRGGLIVSPNKPVTVYNYRRDYFVAKVLTGKGQMVYDFAEDYAPLRKAAEDSSLAGIHAHMQDFLHTQKAQDPRRFTLPRGYYYLLATYPDLEPDLLLGNFYLKAYQRFMRTADQPGITWGVVVGAYDGTTIINTSLKHNFYGSHPVDEIYKQRVGGAPTLGLNINYKFFTKEYLSKRS